MIQVTMVRRGRRFALATLCGVACAALLLTSAVPARGADQSAGATGSVELGGFALGDATEGLIDERDGALSFTVPVAGLKLRWDSRGAGGRDASGLPNGWGFGLSRVSTEGGVRVSPASGGSYELDTTSVSGLAGYFRDDVRFAAGPVEVPERAEAGVDRSTASYRLDELGGATTYFDEAGASIARVDATGARLDWVHDAAGRLLRVVDADGVATVLDWSAEPGAVLVRRGVSARGRGVTAAAAEWRVQLGAMGVVGIDDPLGGRVEIAYDDGLVTRMTGASGATTLVDWQPFDDGIPRVERVRVTDETGAELSARSWSRAGAGFPSGWPLDGSGGAAGAARGVPSYVTELSDGATILRSNYDGWHRMDERTVTVRTSAGDQVLQRQRLDYPGDAAVASAHGELPPDWALPSRVEIESLDATGGSRSVVASHRYDERGRSVRGADGARYAYDATNRPVATTTAAGVTTTFAYWADGTRRTVVRDDPATGARLTTELFWTDGALVNERHAAGSATASTSSGDASYLIGATRHARTTRTAVDDGSAETSHYGTDRHGNVTELTDAAGAITERYGYSDYGRELAPVSDSPVTDAPRTETPALERNPFRYAGEFTEPDGSQFLTERLYLPQLMRFASDDRAPEHNDYAFGHLNPIMMVDPSGRTPSADTSAGWVLTGLGAAASLLSIAGALLTGGSSMSLLGVAGWMVEGGALAASAVTVADEFTPFLSHDQRLGLNVTEIVLGAASTALSRLGFAKYGAAESRSRRAAAEFFNVLGQRRIAWLPHIHAPQFTQGINLLLAERAVLADDVLTSGVRTWAHMPAAISTNLSAARTSLQTPFSNVNGDGVRWVAESLATFRRVAAGGRDALKRRWLTRSLLWREELAAVDRLVGEHAASYAELNRMRPLEFAFMDELQTMKLLITDLTPTTNSITKITNADLLQMIDSHLVPKYAPEIQRLVRLERARN